VTTGFFVVLEGPEGTGKSTLIPRIAERFRDAGAEPVVVREPGGTPAAEALREEVLHSAGRWTAERELLYIVTARADLVARVIRPALVAGQVVLCDRYALSTLAYQAAGRGLPLDKVEWVLAAATEGLRPDLTVILDVPPEVGLARRHADGKRVDRLDRESLEFHQRVAERYLAERGPGIVHVDATLTLPEVEAQVWTAIQAAWAAPAGAAARR
jgi:dTMP kinase